MRTRGTSRTTAFRALLAGVVFGSLAGPLAAQQPAAVPIRPAVPAAVQPAAAPASGAPANVRTAEPSRGAGASRDGEIMRPTATLGPAPGQPASAGSVQGGNMGAAPGAVMPGAPMPGVIGPGGATSAAAAPRFPGMPRYLSIAKPDVVLFDAPSERANKVFFAPAGMPLEVVSVLRNWVKVRDPEGDLTWVVRDDLTDKRMVVANAVLPLRREPQPMAATWFNLDRGVIVELLDERPTNGFVRVKYLEGQIGWLPQGEVWGL